ncbi:MAG: type IV pilus assembly protein PilM [Bdellovibrionales bacterium]|nr:type IV pilus assembly protein PilM [Bdellovibrionales bacterium]
MRLPFLKLKSKKAILGLDIGNKNTKIINLESNKKNKFKLNHCITVPTPPNVFSAGEISNPSVLSEFITNQVLSLGIDNEIEIVLGLSGKGMIAKKIDIPEIEDYMIPEYVEIEAEQEVFYNKEEMFLEYQILEGIQKEDQSNSKSVFAITVLKKIIESYGEAVPKDIVSCKVIDTNFSALFNIFEYTKNLDPKSIYMVIDTGHLLTNVIFVIKNQIVFARNISLGGHFFTQEIQKRLSLEYSAAEDLKITSSQAENSPDNVVSFLKNDLVHQFIEELVSCYELYLSFYPDQQINETYMTGGNSQLLGFSEAFKAKFNTPVYFLNPFQKMSQNSILPKENNSFYFHCVSAGLALRGMEND